MVKINIAEIPNKKENPDLEQERSNHTSNWRTKFIRTRNEIEHILGLRYDSDKHNYIDKMPEIKGLEIIFMRGNILDEGNKKEQGKNAYATYLILLPYIEGDKPLITPDFLPERYVILKTAIEDYLIHTDDTLHLENNPNRAYALEFFLGRLNEEDGGSYKIIMQQVDKHMIGFPCSEMNTPIELP